MISAIKEEIYSLSIAHGQSVRAPEDGVYRAGLLTGLTRALELCRAEEALSGIPSENSVEE